MTLHASHEARVRGFYDEQGDGAVTAYSDLMGPTWHHGDPAVEAAGGTAAEAAAAIQKRIVADAGLRPGSRSVDFGAGPGGATVAMARMSGATIIGLSNSESLSAAARAHAAEQGVEHVAFWTIGDTDYRQLLGWPDNSLDAVTFLESVCHLPVEGREQFFRAVARVLRPGGRLIGLDWLQRAWGDYRTAEQRRPLTDPVSEYIRLAPLGTLDEYAEAMRAAGLTVTVAEDLFADQLCWGSTPEEDRDSWLNYELDLFRQGKVALDNARAAGVFTVGYLVAEKASA